MTPVAIITYLNALADDFDLQDRQKESIYLREAAALVASHTTKQLSTLRLTMGDQVFDMMSHPSAKHIDPNWEMG